MRSALVVCLLAVAACSSSSIAPATNVTVDGTWTANLVVGSSSVVMSLTLSQKGTTVTGTGTVNNPTDPPPAIMTVTGTLVGSTAALTLQVIPQQYNGQTIDQNKSPMQFSGTATATTMKGVLNGGGPPAVVALTANFTKQ